MIYHLEKESDAKPKMVYHRFLNNIEYDNENFIHPNVFIQNGNFIYFNHFQNCEVKNTITATLIKLDLFTGKEVFPPIAKFSI